MEGEFIKIYKKFVYADGFYCLFLILSMKNKWPMGAIMRFSLVSFAIFLLAKPGPNFFLFVCACALNLLFPMCKLI